MSLLNQMLKDLEQRRADAAETPVLHREVRPLPAAAPSRRPFWILLLVVLLLSGAGAGWWFVLGPARPLPQTAVPTQVTAAPLPELAVSAPPIPAPPIPAISSPTAIPAAEPPPLLPAATPSASISPPTSPTPVKPLAEKSSAKLRLSDELTLPTRKFEETPAAPVTDMTIEKRALELNPREQAERLYRAAVVLLGQAREAEGIATLRLALKDDPEHLAARQLLIKFSVDRRDLETAQTDLEEGLRRLPKQTAWAMLLSRIKLDRGDAGGALALLERHESHAGSAADYQGAMAAMLQRLNRQADAEGRFGRAAQTEPGNGRWWIGLGMTREAQGKTTEAREAYRNALGTNGLGAELRSFAETKVR